MKGGPVLVIGAGGAIGLEAVRQLRARDLDVTATWRTHRPEAVAALQALGAQTAQLDLDDQDATRRLVGTASSVLFIPILTASAAAAAHLDAGQPAVFFSSNNVAIDFDATIYEELRKAEARARTAAPHAVILRPTMIYGYPGDGNLSRLMRFMKGSPITPMPGAGRALQQPVYYTDLARAAVGALLDAKQHGGTFAVAGPAADSLQTLYRTARDASGAKTVLLSAPTATVGTLLRSLENRGVKFPIKSAQLLRAERDKIPQGENVILTQTSLRDGLNKLALDMTE